MQKVILFFSALLLIVLAIPQSLDVSAMPSKGRPGKQVTTLNGTVGMWVLEATKTTPVEHRYFLEYEVRGQVVQTFLHGRVEFADYLHKTIEVSGYVDNYHQRLSQDKSGNPKQVDYFQDFYVESVKRIISEPDTVNHLWQDLINLPPPTVGPRKLVVLPITFAGNPLTPFEPDVARGWFFTDQRSVRNWVRDYSFRKADIVGHINPQNGDVANWIPLNTSSDNCWDNMLPNWLPMADGQAQQQGISVSNYQTVVYLFREIPGCEFPISATVGLFGETSGVRRIIAIVPNETMTSEVRDRVMFIAYLHELTHNLGQATHDNGQDGTGHIWEYGDRAGILGSVTNPNFGTNVLRLKLQWYSGTGQCRVVDSQGSHRVFFQSPAIASKGIGPNSPPFCVIVPLRDSSGQPTGEIDVWEWRRQTGFWEQFTTDLQDFVRGGLIVRRVGTNFAHQHVGTILLNPRPEMVCCKHSVVLPGTTWTVTGGYYSLTAGYHTAQRQSATIHLGSNYPAIASEQEIEKQEVRVK